MREKERERERERDKTREVFGWRKYGWERRHLPIGGLDFS